MLGYAFSSLSLSSPAQDECNDFGIMHATRMVTLLRAVFGCVGKQTTRKKVDVPGVSDAMFGTRKVFCVCHSASSHS